MATSSSSSSYPLLKVCLFPLLLVFIVFLCNLEDVFAAQTHTIQLNSLFPSASCKGNNAAKKSSSSSLTVAHKHGPCTPIKHHHSPTHTDILAADQSRVNSIQSKFTGQQQQPDSNVESIKGKKANIPAKSGKTVGSGNFVVTVGLGSPKKDLTMIFDTGSDLTWTQCEPCVKYCYQQQDPKFDPTQSTSYTNISCNSNLCSDLTSATDGNSPGVATMLHKNHACGNTPGCSSSTCVYGIQYGDSSYSVGFLAKEKLSLTQTESVDGFLFGCGENNRGLFAGAAGLIGLGRDKMSIVEQTAAKYGKYFSYCLPSTTSSTGHLTLGKGGRPTSSIKFTPLSSIPQGDNFYGISILSFNVGGQKLSIPASTFSNAPAIIDSGTVITRLPPTAYNALKTAFKQGMTKYPTAPAVSILDTCYDLSKYSSVTIPKVGIQFAGNAYTDLHPNGILYPVSPSQVCLAFSPNSDDTDILIYGNTQQLTFEVVYDTAALKLGFGANGCA